MEILSLLSFVFSVKGLLTLAGLGLAGYAAWQKLRAGREKQRRETAERECLQEKQRRLTAEATAEVSHIQTQAAQKVAEITDRHKTEEVKIVQENDDDIGLRLDSLYPGDGPDNDRVRETTKPGDHNPKG